MFRCQTNWREWRTHRSSLPARGPTAPDWLDSVPSEQYVLQNNKTPQETAVVRQPTPQDKFSFGLWTVGWLGVDPFGSASRPALDPWEYAERLAEGCVGCDLPRQRRVPVRRRRGDEGEDRRPVQGGHRRGRVGDRDGHHEHVQPPGVQGRWADLQRPWGATVRAAQVVRRGGPGSPDGGKHVRDVGGREGSEYDGSKDVYAAMERYKEGLDTVAGTSRRRGTTCGSRWSPSRTSRAVTSPCPPSGTPWR